MKNTHLDQKYLFNFLQNHKLGVLSTVNAKGLPDAAPMYFIPHKDLCLCIVTPVKTQKYINLQHANEALFTVTDEQSKEVVQLRAKVVENAEMLGEMFEKLAVRLNSQQNFETVLPLLKFKNQRKTVLMLKTYSAHIKQYSDAGLQENTIRLKNSRK